MEIVLAVFFAVVGAFVGSFLNVCIDRLPAGKSIVYPPSHCEVCRHRLAPRDLVPVFSYLWLRRRCRYCQAPIPRRLFWVEVGSGLLFAFTYWHYGLSADFAIVTAYCCLFIVIMLIDWKHKLILNKIVYPAMIVALLVSIFLPSSSMVGFALSWPPRVSGIIGGAAGFGLLLIPALVYRGGIGWGDVKLAGLIGLVTGFPLVFVALLVGVLIGGVVAGVMLLLKRKKRKDTIAFGSFLSVGAIIALLWGGNILSWYLGFF